MDNARSYLRRRRDELRTELREVEAALGEVQSFIPTVHHELVIELDRALNGDNAAERPLLCDVVAQVCAEVRKRGKPLLSP